MSRQLYEECAFTAQGRNPFVNQVVGVGSLPALKAIGKSLFGSRRNPFVNQVVGVVVRRCGASLQSCPRQSQSLRESGRWCQVPDSDELTDAELEVAIPS